MSVEARGPLAVARREQLVRALQEQGTVRVSELSDILGAAPVTIRRDIAQLAEAGLVRRVHGGATLVTVPDPGERPEAVVTGTGEARDARPLGMLVPSLDYYWPEVVRGAEDEARRLGRRLVLRGSSYESDDDRTQVERLVDQAGTAGLLLVPNMSAPHAPELIEWLAAVEVPVVLIERSATIPPHHDAVESVVSDHTMGAAIAVRHLVELGHRRVGIVLSAQSPTGPHVRRGWLQAAQECDLPISATVDRLIERGSGSERQADLDQLIDECLSSGTTALLVHADAEAIAIVQRCEERGLSVPGDLSVVAYDDEVAELFSPALTAVRPPRESIGRAATWLLAARLEEPQRPVHRVVISPSLRIRESTAAPRPST